MTPPAPGYRLTIAALSVGQIICWAALYCAVTAFVLPKQRELGRSRPVLVGADTLGLTVSAALSVAVGAAIDRGHGRAVMTLGPLLGAAMAMTLYEAAFSIFTRLYPARFREAVTAITLVGGLASTQRLPAVALGWPAFALAGAPSR